MYPTALQCMICCKQKMSRIYHEAYGDKTINSDEILAQDIINYYYS